MNASRSSDSQITITPAYAEVARELGLVRAEDVFVDARLRVWRDLPDRDNSTLDATLANSRSIRLHVKRDKRRRREPMALEARGIELLESVGVHSAPLVAYGRAGGRTFVVTENLDGYTSADRLLEAGHAVGPILDALAETAAKLHIARLHHRDLYANHFYLRDADAGFDVRLIDTARVRRLPMLFPTRWLVKDVAQLLFSVSSYASESERGRLLDRYARSMHRQADDHFFRRVRSKAAWIAKHDRALREKTPDRNRRLPGGN